MRALFAVPPVGTEAGEEVRAHLLADMFLGAPRAERTEAAVVVWTGRQLALGVDVKVQAFVSVTAEAIPHKEVALRHFSQIKLVKELACLALFAETP